MNMLMTIIALSGVMWYIIDKFKSWWKNNKYSKLFTILFSAIFAFGFSFIFKLDIIYALGIIAEQSIAGQVVTGFALMTGSSAVAEIIEAIKR